MKDLENETRRTFLGFGSLLPTLVLPYGVQAQTSIPQPDTLEYQEAIKYMSKRDPWIKKRFANLPNHVRPLYPDDRTIAEVSRRIGEPLRIPGQFFAATVLDGTNLIPGNNNPASMYFFEECFHPAALENPAFANDLEIVVLNTGYNHEKVHVDHLHTGIPNYPTRKFFRQNGRFNGKLFSAVSEIFAPQEEYKGLKEYQHKAKTGLYKRAMDATKILAMDNYLLLFDPKVAFGMDPEFMAQLRRELNPKNLNFG